MTKMDALNKSLNYSLDDSMTLRIVLFNRALLIASVIHPYCCLLQEHESAMYAGAFKSVFQANNDLLSHHIQLPMALPFIIYFPPLAQL